MIARVAIWLAAALALLMLAVFAAGYWLLNTSPGSRWTWYRVTSAVPGELRAEAVDGSLTGGFRLTGLSWRNPALSVAVSQAELALDLDLFPPSVNIVRLNLTDAVVQQLGGPQQEEPAGSFAPENLALPLELDIRALNIENLQVLDAGGRDLLNVDRAELAGQWHEAITLSRLEVDSSAGSISGSAALALHEPYDASASLAAGFPLQIGEDPPLPLRITASAAGSLEKLQIEVDSDEPNLSVAGTVLQLLEDPGWNLRVRSRYFQWPLASESPGLRLTDVVLDTTGELSQYAVTGDGIVAVTADDELHFALEFHGGRGGIDVDRLELHGALLDAGAGGELRWEDGIAVTANADVERFDPSVLTPRWPAGTPVSGTARAGWSAAKVELTEVRLRVEETGQTVDATGLIDVEQGVVDLKLDWRDLAWPIARPGESAGPRYRSEFGKVTVTGKPEAWTLDGRIAFRMPELPQGIFQLSGTGSRERMALTLNDSQVLGGRVAGHAEYDWGAGGRWAADLTAASIDTGPLAPGWPGNINADFDARGQVDPMRIDIGIDSLSGTIRDRPVSGKGGILVADGTLDVRQLQISSGESLLQANGSLRSEAGIDFTLEVASLAALRSGAAGSLEANGNVSLKEELPKLRVDLQGRRLAWGEYRLESLAVTTPADASAPLALDIEGQGIEIGERAIETLTAEFTGSETRQQLHVDLIADEKRLQVGLDGRLENWRRPLESGWKGRLQALKLQAPGGADFALAKPADLSLGKDRMSLKRACLAGNGTARICLKGNRDGPADFAASAELDAVPVDLLKLLLDTDLEFTQTLDGSLAVSDTADTELSARASLNISPGQIRNPDDSRLAMRTRAGVLNVDLADGRVLSGRFTLPFTDTAAIDAEFAVADIAMGSESGVSGDLAVNLNDIGVVSGVITSIESAKGRVDVDIDLAGTLDEPVWSGHASLTDGALNYVPMGLKLTDIRLESRILQGNRIDLQSTFRAGDGTGRIYSSSDSLGSIGEDIELSLTGDKLTLIDLPQVNVVADLDLDLAITPKELSINGDVLVPRARLSPREIASGRVGESKDVVVVASREGEQEEEQAAAAPPIAITGQVDLTLGKDVLAEFEAGETRLTGTTSFVWNGPAMPTATGEYKVTGKFEAYGQLLEITEGSIRFPGVPAINPVIRIRAEREIFGNPRIRSAGVLVTGPAQNPELEVYTNPATNKERALTMLVTGSDFNYEQGVGAVDVGTYIAPDLYLSYGIGLFDRENVISVRYDLAKGFGIKATSGKSAEGVDLSYTFER